MRPGTRGGRAEQARWTTRAPRVLLAEDDRDMRELVARALRLDRYLVVEARDGEELFGLLERHVAGSVASRFDLLVCDIRMPGWSGLDILAWLRAADPGIPVILMTAFASHDVRRAVETSHAVLFDKPFELDDLRTAVVDLVGHAS